MFNSAFDDEQVGQSFLSRDDFEESRSAKLLGILDRWEKGTIAPQDVLFETAVVMGADVSFLISYTTGKEYLPGTRNFAQQQKYRLEEITRRQQNILQFSQRTAQECAAQIEYVKKREAEAGAPHRSKHFVSQRSTFDKQNLEKRIAEAPKDIPDYTQDQFEGPAEYVAALTQLVALRKAATAELSTRPQSENDLVVINTAILKILINKHEAEYDDAHRYEALERHKKETLAKHQETVQAITDHFKPEVMARDSVVIDAIHALRSHIENGDMDSIAAATAIFETLYKPEAQIMPDAEYMESIGAEIDSFGGSQAGYEEDKDSESERDDRPDINGAPFTQLMIHLQMMRKVMDLKFPTAQRTMEQMSAESEADFKRRFAKALAQLYAYKMWLAEKEKSAAPEPKEDEWSEQCEAGFEFSDFAAEGKPGYNKADSNPVFKSPIDAGGRKLCNTIYIQPAGAHLIEVFKRAPGERDCIADLYGGFEVARITVYQLTFVPKDPADTELLREKLNEAQWLLRCLPYKHGLNGHTGSGQGVGYERTVRAYEESPIILEDGKLTLEARLDLDDLMLFYYLLENVIEPSEQIAIALDAARYAEERGSILKSDGRTQFCEKHVVANPVGSLEAKNDEELLLKIVDDALMNLATGQINEAGFLTQITIAADHTLTGALIDPSQKLLPYSATMQAASGNNGASMAIVAYDDALKDRIAALLALRMGSTQGSDLKALMSQVRAFVQQAKAPLRAEFTRRALEDRDSAAAAAHADWMVNLANVSGNTKELDAALNGGLSADDTPEEAKRKINAGPLPEPDPDTVRDVTIRPNSLVVAGSSVEPHIDGLHYGGHYRTRTKGSVFVRYELPDALKPLVTATRPDVHALLLPAFTESSASPVHAAAPEAHQAPSGMD